MAALLQYLPDCDSDRFNMAIGGVIFGNAILIGLETDSATEGEEYALFEHIFCWIFIVEAAMRLLKHGCSFLCSVSNFFDFFLVVSGAASLYIMPLLTAAMNPDEPGAAPGKHKKSGGSFVSIMRLLKLLRVMRILRIFKLFSELALILRAFFKALSTVMWIGILVLVLDYVVAIFAVQTVGHHADLWGDKEGDIKHWFGCIGNAMETLFVVMTLAGWEEISDTVMLVYPPLVVFPLFICYIIIAAYTMVSLVTGIISESLMSEQHQDEAHRTQQMEEMKTIILGKLEPFFVSAGLDCRTLRRQQVRETFRADPRFVKSLSTVNITATPDQVDRMLERLQEDTLKGIQVDSIAEALLQLNGFARASEIFDIKSQVTLLRSEIEQKLDVRLEAFAAYLAASGYQTTSNYEDLV